MSRAQKGTRAIKSISKIRTLLPRPSRTVASGVIDNGTNSSHSTPPERIDQIPVDELPCGRFAQECGYERRLCDYCLPIFLPSQDNGGGELRGGDMCAGCGYMPPDAQSMAISDVSSVLFRAARAGASRADLWKVVGQAITECDASIGECQDDGPNGWRPAATWPATW